jgi:hypothetical protein
MDSATWFALDNDSAQDLNAFITAKTNEFDVAYANDPSQLPVVDTGIVIETVPGPPLGCSTFQTAT